MLATFDIVQVINDWVQLSPDGGSLHVMVEYDPVGLEPMVRSMPVLLNMTTNPSILHAQAAIVYT